MTTRFARVSVIGGGAWGTALGLVACRAGADTVLWARDPAVVAAINGEHRNPLFLPGIALDPGLTATTVPVEAVRGADLLLLVVPAQFLRGVLEILRQRTPPSLPALICAKGIEHDTLMLMTEVAAELMPRSPLAVLSGPTFAAEVARDLPTAVTIASTDATLAQRCIATLGSNRFRPYYSEDPIGAEIGGAVKNVLAIACGIIQGRGLGDNARAALITRGLAEMTRLGLALGGRAETLSGLSGLGDLVLTCSAGQSRNYSLGMALGQGQSLEAALAGRRAVVEGVATATALTQLAKRLGVEMPVAAAVEAVLNRGVSIDAMAAQLLSRPLRAE